MAQRKQHGLEKNILIAKLIIASIIALIQFLYLLIQDPTIYIMTNLSIILGYFLEVIPSICKKGWSTVKTVSWVCLVFYIFVVLFSFGAFVFRIDFIFEQLKDTSVHFFFYEVLPILSFTAVFIQCGYFLLLFFNLKCYE